MKSREYFGKWPPRNVFGVERQKLYDEHNRSFKKERPTQPSEYASTEIEEYYRIPESKDESGNPYEENDRAKSSRRDNSRSSKSAGRHRILGQVATFVVGLVVVVTTYQSMAARQAAAPEPPPIIQPSDSADVSNSDQTEVGADDYLLVWKWSDDKQSVTLELYDTDGILIKEIPAVIEAVETPATCNVEGLMTYTASAQDGDNSYSDTQTEVIPPTGHAFDEGTETVLENGQTALVFECAHCHEKFTVVTSLTETD